MSLIRSLAFIAWVYVTLVIASLWHAPMTMRTTRGPIAAVRMWGKFVVWGLRWIGGSRVVIEGKENLVEGPVILAAKHQSMLDVLLPALFRDFPAFVYKIELHDEPFMGWYLKNSQMIPVEREAQAAALKSMLRAARKCRDAGRDVVIFPEGTRQQIGAPPDYKPGVAALYRDLNMPVIPIALNTGTVWPAKGIHLTPGTVTVRILPAIPPGLSREDFMRELETRIETESEKLLPPERRRAAQPAKVTESAA